jgi:hypothetical protein
MIMIRGMIKPAAGYQPLAFLPRKLSKQPGSWQSTRREGTLVMTPIAQSVRKSVNAYSVSGTPAAMTGYVREQLPGDDGRISEQVDGAS